MNLLNDSWIPVLREDGSSDTISPLDLLDDSKENPVVEIHTVRPDFDSAVLQFLIGLYQVLLSPEDEDDWRDLLDNPPTRSALSSKIELVLPAFSFDEGEFRFMQDASVKDASVKDTDTWEIQKLLLDIDNTLFLKEGQIEHLCPRCAAMALLTLQLNAPSGGRGHRTSLRGGGPLTTLVTLPSGKGTLWQNICLNLIPEEMFPSQGDVSVSAESLPLIFPWVGEVPNSEKDETALPDDYHPYHVYWNIPRRIFLDFSSTNAGVCDVCGAQSERLLSSYWSRPKGMNYDSSLWRHPFTPYWGKKDAAPLPRRPKENELSYANWVGLIFGSASKGRNPASVVRTASSLLRTDAEFSDLKIHVSGYITDNAKVRAWEEGWLPLFSIPDSVKDAFESEISLIIDTASWTSSILILKVKQGLTGKPDLLKGDIPSIKSSFWNLTEPAFQQVISRLPDVLMSGSEEQLFELKRNWLSEIRRVSLGIFSEWVSCPVYGELNPACAAKAEWELSVSLLPSNAKLCKILGLPAPEKKKKVK